MRKKYYIYNIQSGFVFKLLPKLLMSKKIKVLLLQNVKNHGNKGDIVEVSPSYAQNVLIRQGKAKIADKHTIQKRKAKKGLATLCIGGGMGIAMCIENNFSD